MISSAVVIPEQISQSPNSPPRPLKRRQSSVSSESSKRPRLDSQYENGEILNDGSPPNSTAPGGSPTAARRKSSTTGVNAVEEKKRGQRLFGSLLGTLSQTNTKPAHRRRDEIEKRQRERLRKDNEEREEEQRRKRAELDKVRRIEQKAWDEEGMRLRHRNMRAMAGFLKTQTRPILYYKPWELREEEREQITKQVKDTDDNIELELEEHAAKKEKESITEDPAQPHPTANPNNHDESNPDKNQDEQMDEDKPDTNGHANNQDDEPTAEKPTTGHHQPSEGTRAKDDDHGGEELVEGHEDDVIY